MGDSIITDSMDGDHEVTYVGRVLGLDGSPIEGATLDVWETASNEVASAYPTQLDRCARRLDDALHGRLELAQRPDLERR